MTVSVAPERFTLVFFDNGEIATAVAGAMRRLGADDLTIVVTVDESTPLARIRAERRDDGVVELAAMSGAFEDTQRPRHFSSSNCESAVFRVLRRLLDRDAEFHDAPADDDLTLAEAAAWDTFCMARAGRTGIPVNQQRWRYNFRNRHGFTDVADDVFDEIWRSEDISWAGLSGLSQRALAARPAA